MNYLQSKMKSTKPLKLWVFEIVVNFNIKNSVRKTNVQTRGKSEPIIVFNVIYMVV